MARRSFRPTSALAASVGVTDEQLVVTLTDGRVVAAPLHWFPTLLTATREQRAAVEIEGGGIGLHWEELDEDLLISGLLAGATPDKPPLPSRAAVIDSLHMVKRMLEVPGGGRSVGPLVHPKDVFKLFISQRPGLGVVKSKIGKRTPRRPAPKYSLTVAKPGEVPA